jgi:putative cell wall-binding protein
VRVRALVGLLTASVVLAAIGINPAAADWNDPSKKGPDHAMTFPVVGKVTYIDSFKAPRDGGARQHLGQDLMGAKMMPLVAAKEGTVTSITIPQASYGYALTITDSDGWRYNYLHINNDTPGTDDGKAALTDVFAPGIARGTKVVAGQLVAWMGDSGNAEDAGAHLHFELLDPSGAYVNSFAALNAAPHLTVPVAAGAQPSTVETKPAAASSGTLPRLSGADRVGTALAASQSGWPSGAPAAVLASGDQFAEALPASVLAAKLGGPLLLTQGTTLRADVLAELTRLQTKAVTVVGSVPTAIDTVLAAKGFVVSRVAGADRTATAAALAKVIGAADNTVVLVNADRFPDAVSAAGLAAGRGWPILLSTGTSIPQVTVDAWRSMGVTRVLLLGGTAVLSDSIAKFVPGAVRVAGADRYATSAAVADFSLTAGGRAVAQMLLATGTNYPDGLTAGSLAARRVGIVLLIDGSGSGADAAGREFLTAHKSSITAVTVLGGTSAVSRSAEGSLASALSIAASA